MTFHITLNIDPYRVDDAQRRRITDAVGGTVELHELPRGADLDQVDGSRTTVLVSEDIPNDLSRWPALRFIQVVSAGINHLDGHPIWKTDIPVATAAGTHAVPIGQYTTCALLMLVHHMPQTTAFKSTRTWPDRIAMQCTMLRGKTASMLGYGGIGRECARQLHALGMRIVCLKNNPEQRRQEGFISSAGVGDPDGALPEQWFGPDELPAMLAMSDALIVSAPMTPKTKGLIGRRELAMLPKGSRIVIVSRGGIVDEPALAESLASGHLAGAVVDTYVQEPPPRDHPFFDAPNLIMTPHMSGVFAEYWTVASELLCLNLQRFVRGQPLLNRVAPSRGY